MRSKDKRQVTARLDKNVDRLVSVTQLYHFLAKRVPPGTP